MNSQKPPKNTGPVSYLLPQLLCISCCWMIYSAATHMSFSIFCIDLLYPIYQLCYSYWAFFLKKLHVHFAMDIIKEKLDKIQVGKKFS